MNENETVIRVKDLVVAFGSFHAVDGVSFDVHRGEIFGFLGANGAGKTTTIRTICGLLNPSAGTVEVNGHDVSSSTAVLKPLIGYMSQKFTLYPDLTVRENMNFAGSLYGMSPRQIAARAHKLMEFIGLPENIPDPVSHLSGGVKQMAALASALLHDPELVFLDEPTAGTSPQTRVAFWALIRRLAQLGKTVFVTTHYMDEAEYCGRIALMERGKIVAMGTPEELKKEFFPVKPLELTFLHPVQNALRAALAQAGIASAVFGNNLRVRAPDRAAFERATAPFRNDFTVCETNPTLEDVFLQAVSGRKKA